MIKREDKNLRPFHLKLVVSKKNKIEGLIVTQIKWHELFVIGTCTIIIADATHWLQY